MANDSGPLLIVQVGNSNFRNKILLIYWAALTDLKNLHEKHFMKFPRVPKSDQNKNDQDTLYRSRAYFPAMFNFGFTCVKNIYRHFISWVSKLLIKIICFSKSTFARSMKL